MKKIFFSVLAVTAMLFTACNSNSKKKAEQQSMNSMKKDTGQHAIAKEDKAVKAVAVSFTNVDARAAASIKEIVDHYLHIKTSLTNDNGNEAANGGKAMAEAIRKLDKSLLTAEQKKLFDAIEESLQEDAEHIGKNADKIRHQREHFATMSEVMYSLIKAFGAGIPIYHDHCPMYNEGKGAMWLSEISEIKNPYYGTGMPTCGSVEEVIK